MREIYATLCGQAEDRRGQAPHGAGDIVAIGVEGLEARRANVGLHIHDHALDDVMEIAARQLVGADGVA